MRSPDQPLLTNKMNFWDVRSVDLLTPQTQHPDSPDSRTGCVCTIVGSVWKHHSNTPRDGDPIIAISAINTHGAWSTTTSRPPVQSNTWALHKLYSAKAVTLSSCVDLSEVFSLYFIFMITVITWNMYSVRSCMTAGAHKPWALVMRRRP